MADWYKASLTPSSGVSQIREEEAAEEERRFPLLFNSRRSALLCRRACVATSQPTASAVGYDILKQGGNAADAAVAVAAALAVTEPCSTGLGGDMFSLWYDSSTRKVSCVNGSGKSGTKFTWDRLQKAFPKEGSDDHIDEERFRDSALAVTVPGAAQGWYDLHKQRGSGKFTFAQLMEPAALLAEEGFPVAPVTSHHWIKGFDSVTKWLDDEEKLNPPLSTGKNPPHPGDIVFNKDMARVLRDLGEKGPKEGFYQGETGKAIVEAVQKHGGCLTQENLDKHTSTFPEAICAEYRGCRLWQVPPNGQGVAGLIALQGLSHLEESGKVVMDQVGTSDFYHVLIEMMRLGFADAQAEVTDLEFMSKEKIAWLMDKERIGKRAESLFDPNKAVIHGVPDATSCTVSFQVVDQEGNAISFVNSNFMGFGTGIVPKGCGFTLQNRGFGFTLDKHHPNSPAPEKRPFHTIIPGMLTHADTDELYASFTNMGGNMQPQGHLQLTVALLAGNLNPQEAIDLPRFCIVDGSQNGRVYLEESVDEKVVRELRLRGHLLEPGISGFSRSIFGKAQIIKRDRETGVLWAGSEGRADGCAMGF